MNDDIIRWIGLAILPHEADVRRWLRRKPLVTYDTDDLIQEAYARIMRGANPNKIGNPRGYFFRVIKNILIDEIRRQNIVRIDSLDEMDNVLFIDPSVPVDRQIEDREEHDYVFSMLNKLPEKMRVIFLLRRIEGLSQRQTAERLGINENVVQKQTALGLKKLLDMIRSSADEHGFEPRKATKREHKRNLG